MITIGYQTLEDRDNIDEIETDGPFFCIRQNAWLGRGCYFWDYDISWAHDWGKKAYERQRKSYIIGKCDITLGDTCFDLHGNMKQLNDFRDIVEVIKSSNKFNGKRLIVSNIIEYMKSKRIFNYKLIRASEIPTYVNKISFGGNRDEHMVTNPRVQICVIDKKGVVLSPFKVIYPE
jgi:hypothetical protein